jgi:prepilin-type N-terminal cleavage/methylation domain-containing protein
MSQTAKRSMSGFTLVELLVVTAIIGVLISLLMPSLSQARAVAKGTLDQSNQRGILQGALSYAADNKQSLPYSRGFEGADFTPVNPPGVSGTKNAWVGIYSPCGPYIWGAYSAGQSNGIWGINAITNGPLGFGAIIVGGYAPIDVFYSPNDRISGGRTENGIAYPSWWELRKYFGQPYTTGWTQDGLAWGYWDGQSNFQQPCSYLFRMADWQTTTFDPDTQLHTSSSGPASSADFKVAINPRNLRTDTAGFNTKVQIMNDNPAALLPLPGANVGYGDGSVVFWRSQYWIEGAYSRGENWNHATKSASNPYINRIPGESWSGWRTLRLNAAERFARP